MRINRPTLPAKPPPDGKGKGVAAIDQQQAKAII